MDNPKRVYAVTTAEPDAEILGVFDSIPKAEYYIQQQYVQKMHRVGELYMVECLFNPAE